MSMLACVISIGDGPPRGFKLPRQLGPAYQSMLQASATLTPVGRHLSMSRSRDQVVSEAWINPGVHVLSILRGCSEQRSGQRGLSQHPYPHHWVQYSGHGHATKAKQQLGCSQGLPGEPYPPPHTLRPCSSYRQRWRTWGASSRQGRSPAGGHRQLMMDGYGVSMAIRTWVINVFMHTRPGLRTWAPY